MPKSVMSSQIAIREPGGWSTINPDTHDNARFDLLASYWKSKCSSGEIPSRADIDPVDLKKLLGWIFIAQHRPQHDDFYYRLIGSNLTMMQGREFTRKTVAEVFEPLGSEVVGSVLAGYRKVVEEGVSLRARGRFLWGNKDWLSFDSIHFPLRDDRGGGGMVLGLIDFDTVSGG